MHSPDLKPSLLVQNVRFNIWKAVSLVLDDMKGRDNMRKASLKVCRSGTYSPSLSWDTDIKFYTRTISNDFSNVSKRNIFPGSKYIWLNFAKFEFFTNLKLHQIFFHEFWPNFAKFDIWNFTGHPSADHPCIAGNGTWLYRLYILFMGSVLVVEQVFYIVRYVYLFTVIM